jgi:hypothetical protein
VAIQLVNDLFAIFVQAAFGSCEPCETKASKPEGVPASRFILNSSSKARFKARRERSKAVLIEERKAKAIR